MPLAYVHSPRTSSLVVMYPLLSVDIKPIMIHLTFSIPPINQDRTLYLATTKDCKKSRTPKRV